MSVKSLQKQLLAAIAMVVVAAIAMSSATFAWFVNNSQVTATGATATATTSKLLLISTDSTNYGTSTDLGISLKALTPVSASASLIQNDKFYKVKSWANGDAGANNPYGVLADTYVKASGGVDDSDGDVSYDYAVQTIYLKSDVAKSNIALDSTTTQLTASKTVEVGGTKYNIVATYLAGETETVVCKDGETDSVDLSSNTELKSAADLLADSLGALRIALVPYTGDDYDKAGDPIVLTTNTTSKNGYYNTNGSTSANAANITGAKVVNEVTALSETVDDEFTAELVEDPAEDIKLYTAKVKADGEVDTAANTNIGTLTEANKAYCWKAYIYIEGCDSDCVSTIAGNVEYSVQLGFIQSMPQDTGASNSQTGSEQQEVIA
jgi:hypothetical protein